MGSPYDSGFIQVEFETLATTSSNLGLAHATLVDTLEKLDQQVRGSLAQWTSSARDLYQQKSNDNQLQCNHLASVLLAMSTHVSQAHEAYTSTELRNASMWQ